MDLMGTCVDFHPTRLEKIEKNQKCFEIEYVEAFLFVWRINLRVIRLLISRFCIAVQFAVRAR